MNEPREVTAGNTIEWVESLSDYPASVWTLTYEMRGLGGEIRFDATADGDDHRVRIDPATSAAWTPGEYRWWATVRDGTDVYTLTRAASFLTVHIDPATIPAGEDQRTWARRCLEALEAVMESRASLDQARYSIGSRSLDRMMPAEQRAYHAYFAARVAAEEAEARLEQGKRTGNQVRVRFP